MSHGLRVSGCVVCVLTLVVFALTSYLGLFNSLGEAGRSRLLLVLTLQTLCVILGMVALAIFTTHRLAGPLIALLRAFEDVKAGDLDRQLRFRKSDNHMADLEREFNEMMASIRHRVDGERAPGARSDCGPGVGLMRRPWLAVGCSLVLGGLAQLAPAQTAQTPDPPPLLPEPVVRALAAEVSGAEARRTAQDLTLFHRMRGSRGFRAAAERVRDRLRQYGLTDVQILELPADGTDLLWHPALAAGLGRRLRRALGAGARGGGLGGRAADRLL